MLHFNLNSPAKLIWFGEFVSPKRGWKHLTRTLYEYELMIVTEGTLFIADEKREYVVGAGEYLIMSPTRSQHGTQECSCRFYWLHFQCESLPASVSLPAQGRYPDGEGLAGLINRLFEAERREPRGVRSHYLASELILELASERENEAQTPLPSPQQVLTEKIKNYVEWHRFSDIRVFDIASELGYHEKYLSAVFRETEGISLKQYLLQKRLHEAERLLLDTDYTVAEVAYYLNFRSPHNFSRFFKTQKALSPVEYRKTKKISNEQEEPSLT